MATARPLRKLLAHPPRLLRRHTAGSEDVRVTFYWDGDSTHVDRARSRRVGGELCDASTIVGARRCSDDAANARRCWQRV